MKFEVTLAVSSNPSKVMQPAIPRDKCNDCLDVQKRRSATHSGPRAAPTSMHYFIPVNIAQPIANIDAKATKKLRVRNTGMPAAYKR